MLVALYLLLNSTLSLIQVPYVPYTFSTYLGGCANVTAYLDPLSGYGISSVYVIDQYGNIQRALLAPYSTPTYVTGRICGSFLSIVVDKWRAVGPLIPVSYGTTSTYALIGTIQLNLTDGALVEVKSLYKPNVTGSFIYKVEDRSAMGVYLVKYLAYGSQIAISGYGLVNVTPISLSSKAPDYYVYVPEPGVNLSGGFPAPISGLRFAPSQIYVLGKPTVVVSQVQIPVVGQCGGTAYVSDPLARPVSVIVQLNDGETYTLQSPEFPKAVNTTLLLGINATDLAGTPLSDYNITVYPTTADGAPVGRCLVYGVPYYVAVAWHNATFYYPAALVDGYLVARTDLVKPKVVIYGWGTGEVSPRLARAGSNVTVTVYLNGTAIARYAVKAQPVISINDTNLAEVVHVVDILGSPLDSFEVIMGNLTFRGAQGAAVVIPLSSYAVIRYRGVEYTVQLGATVRLPVMTADSLVKIMAASLAAGVSTALATWVRRSDKREEVEETVDV
ncbi:hypothetical protein TUZN_0722 [Thermoproteus uzoniensis 768-20]|uniref:Thermopsin n=1 Tax=Thermoproteus uzoniensis (strain 768-20) TaxID=999630 RepID=F2L4N4_THEU7|nr:hypothetical protein [Thermoproteus uzoniensis]AEA12212.1 hypothetical protein TUZN_0722 [Thermoproteus uzoniensis 768-20]